MGIRKTNSVLLGQNQGVSKAVLPLEALGENPLHDLFQPLEKHLDSSACGSYHHQRQQENSFNSLSAAIKLPSHFCCSHPFYKDTDCSYGAPRSPRVFSPSQGPELKHVCKVLHPQAPGVRMRTSPRGHHRFTGLGYRGLSSYKRCRSLGNTPGQSLPSLENFTVCWGFSAQSKRNVRHGKLA